MKQMDLIRKSLVGEIATDMTHQINNSLAIIVLCSESLALTDLGGDKANCDQAFLMHLDKINSSVSRINNLYKTLKLVSGTLHYEPTFTLDLQTLIQDCIVLCQTFIHRHGVTVNFQQNEPRISIKIKPSIVAQIFVSAFIDAIAHISKNSLKFLLISVEGLGERAIITLKDSATGKIPEIDSNALKPNISWQYETSLYSQFAHDLCQSQGGQMNFVQNSRNHYNYTITLPILDKIPPPEPRSQPT